MPSPDRVLTRCPWTGADPLYVAYHDEEWGVPVFDDRVLFEFLVLEGAQAGLSWLTVLRKRSRYREIFEGFSPEAVARFDDERIELLLADKGIIRNRLKVTSAVSNARCFLEVQSDFGGFAPYIWRFTDGRIRHNTWRELAEVPAETRESREMSKNLRGRGFRFVGPTICYAFMQAVGMVNDHLTSCFRHRELAQAQVVVPGPDVKKT
ncbi:MAG: DNA-3-methyladenine glycosylase I [Desulfobacterales bacterium]